MKLLIILFLSLIVYISSAAAENGSDTVSVKQLIEQVKKSTGDDRRIAMNALKIKLRSMNQETRSRAMKELQKSFVHQQRGMPNAQNKKMLQGGHSQGQGMMYNQPVNHLPQQRSAQPQGSNIPSRPVPHPVVPGGGQPHFGQPGGRH